MSLPKWLKEAIKLRVVTLAEAQELWGWETTQPDNEMDWEELPSHLLDPVERLELWVMPVEGSVQ